MELTNEPVMRVWPSGQKVDVALVIALDVSASVTEDEYTLMREGLARALDSSEVANAIRSGNLGAIALGIMHWSGFQEQRIKTDWTYVTGRTGLRTLADDVRRSERRYYGGATDIGGAITFCQKMLLGGPAHASRRIIDLVGDGTNNVNFSPRINSDQAAAAGITTNALAIPIKDAGLVAYYRQTVIGGQAAFVEQTPDYIGFATAMKRKLVREITSLYS